MIALYKILTWQWLSKTNELQKMLYLIKNIMIDQISLTILLPGIANWYYLMCQQGLDF